MGAGAVQRETERERERASYFQMVGGDVEGVEQAAMLKFSRWTKLKTTSLTCGANPSTKQQATGTYTMHLQTLLDS